MDPGVRAGAIRAAGAHRATGAHRAAGAHRATGAIGLPLVGPGIGNVVMNFSLVVSDGPPPPLPPPPSSCCFVHLIAISENIWPLAYTYLWALYRHTARNIYTYL